MRSNNCNVSNATRKLDACILWTQILPFVYLFFSLPETQHIYDDSIFTRRICLFDANTFTILIHVRTLLHIDRDKYI